MATVTRRTFLTTSGLLSFVAPFDALVSRIQSGAAIRGGRDYGPLRAVADATTGLPLLELPEGFRYLSFGWTGDRLSDGGPTPPAHDGMAAFAGEDDSIVLVRNHELSPAPAFGAGAYDAFGGGGTISLTFDPRTERVRTMVPSLTGTLRNCAGGPTPWGSWLSCEETVIGPAADNPLRQPHGYVFEVPSRGVATAEPLKPMGRFVHEATAIDPDTGIVYETEDQRAAGLYRFVPRTRGRLADGGTLQMLAIDGRPRFDTREGQRGGDRYGIHWVDIAEPDRAHADDRARDNSGVRQQGLDQGGAVFARLEGAWFGDGRLYITATSGGPAQMGQVWEIDPKASTLHLIFESPGSDVLSMPDNVCLSPRGCIVLCENGATQTRIHGLTRDGRLFTFARNTVQLHGEHNGLTGDFRVGEFAGATYSPDGKWLFVNIQRPGITLAITGPWQHGLL
jgi:secreted PhoX family phosphatase